MGGAASLACLAVAGCGSIQLLGDAGADATSGGAGGRASGNGGTGTGRGSGGSQASGAGGRTGSADAGPVTCIRAQGCCGADSDCTALQECAGPACSSAGAKATGVCKTRPTRASGHCWTDADCTSGAGTATCSGASVCPCGSACLVADVPGTCSH